MSLVELTERIESAYERIAPHVKKTRLIHSQELSDIVQGNVYLKLESEQHTGSFKARGALNKVKASLPTVKTFITASTGNHGAGFGRAIETTQQKGIVCLPINASKTKVEKIKSFPVQIITEGNSPLETELFAKAYAKDHNAIYVSPYNDLDIIAGQGTIGLELASQLDRIDNVLVTIGGGGLIAGIGAYLKSQSTSVPSSIVNSRILETSRHGINIIGCEPINSMEMTLSLCNGTIVDQSDAKDTLSDGSAGGIEPGAITFPICQQVVDDTIVVEEKSINQAIKWAYDAHDLTIEGAAGVTIASLLKAKKRFK